MQRVFVVATFAGAKKDQPFLSRSITAVCSKSLDISQIIRDVLPKIPHFFDKKRLRHMSLR